MSKKNKSRKLLNFQDQNKKMQENEEKVVRSKNHFDNEQKVKLLSMCKNSNELEAVMDAIKKSILSFAKIESVITIYHHQFKQDTYGLENCLEAYTLFPYISTLMLDKILTKGCCDTYFFKKICIKLNNNVLSVKTLSELLDSRCLGNIDSNKSKKFDIICSLLQYMTFKNILKKFKPNFDIDEMLLVLIDYKLHTLQLLGKISLNKVQELKQSISRPYTYDYLENIIRAIDNDFPFELIELIAKNKKYIYSEIVEAYNNSKLSLDAVNLIMKENNSHNRNSLFDLFVNTNLDYNQISLLYQNCRNTPSLYGSSNLALIVDFFAGKT